MITPKASTSCLLRFSLSLSLSWHTTHTTTAECRAEKQCRHRGANSGQKTKRGIEGEDPTAAFLCVQVRFNAFLPEALVAQG